jgi:integrase
LNAGKGSALELSGVDRDNYVAAVKKLRELRPLEVSLATAIAEYVDAKKLGAPLTAAAKFYLESNASKLPDKAVAEVVAEFLVAKKADGCSYRYLTDCKSRLGHFARDFRLNLKDVQTADLNAWLRGLKQSPTSRNNYRRVICSLFSFAKDAGYLAKGKETEAHASAKAKEAELDIQVYTPGEYATLLEAADEKLLPFLVFGGLAGMRSEEIKRLDWEQVNWQEGVIHVRGIVSKKGKKRNAPLLPAAAAWLADWKGKTGRVVGHIDLYERLVKLSESIGVPRKDNALRHSFCSYRMATVKNAAQVAFEAGNSIDIVSRHYDKVCTETEGNAWFSIMPETAANVVQMVKTA